MHDCEIKIPYTKEDLKIVENLGSVYQADYNLEYNFYYVFVQFLLNGISDQALNISPQCIKFLNDHGNRMKEAMIAMGEESND